MSKHTKGPWVPNTQGTCGYAIWGDGKETVVASCVRKENANRIVACVNACEGINPEAMPKMRAALDGIADRINKTRQWGGGARKGMIDGLEALAKAALEACDE